jgi:hypothetical protein
LRIALLLLFLLLRRVLLLLLLLLRRTLLFFAVPCHESVPRAARVVVFGLQRARVVCCRYPLHSSFVRRTYH